MKGNDSIMLTIVIPTYNREILLRRCLENLLKQSYQKFEVIVVDDGSTDNTQNMVNELTTKFYRLKYLCQENNGAPSARNLGLKNATGKYIIFHDSDDLMHQEKIKIIIDFISKNKFDALVCSIKEYKSNDLMYEPLIDIVTDPISNFLKGNLHGGTQSWVFSKEIVNTIGGYDLKLVCNQDLDITFRFLTQSPKVSICPEAVTYFYEHDGVRISSKAESVEGINSTLLYFKKRSEYVASTANKELIENEIKRLFYLKVKCLRYKHYQEMKSVNQMIINLNKLEGNFIYKFYNSLILVYIYIIISKIKA